MNSGVYRVGVRYRLSLIGVWICFVSALEVHAENPLPDTLDNIRGSVVAVGTMRPVKGVNAKGPAMRFMGTGFVVGNGRQVITNMHVLPESLNEEIQETLVVFAGRGKDAMATSVRIIKTDPVHDLALLEYSGLALKPMTLLPEGFVREGTDVAFTGFPIGMVIGLYPVTHRAVISAITPFVMPAFSSEQLSAVQIKRLKNPFDVYQLDAIAYPGNSGSPVYDVSTGVVVGVVNSVFVKESKESVLAKPSGIAYVIPIHYVHQLMSGL